MDDSYACSETQEVVLNTKKSALAVIDEGMQNFNQIYDETVNRALEEVDAMVGHVFQNTV